MPDELHIHDVSGRPESLEFIGKEEARRLGIEMDPDESEDILQEISRRVTGSGFQEEDQLF